MSKYPTTESQDNTRVVKQQKEEAIPIPIVSKQSYVSPDNRTDWQREQSQKQAERDYNQLMKDKTTQEGLRNIIGFANFADAAGLAFGGLSLLGKGAKWALKRGLTRSSYTSDIIQLLGERKTKDGLTGLRTKDVNPLAEYLEKQGVDVSQLSNNDLRYLMEIRKQSLLSSLPQGRSVTAVEIGNGTQRAIDYHLHEGADNIGDLSTIVENGKQHAGSIEKISQNSNNVSRDLYDGSLIYGKQRGYKGLISGEVLQSPEMTKHVWEKYYPNRKLISRDGVHNYNQGRDVVKNGEPFVDSHGEVVDLVKPSSEIPLKSENIFHPSLIKNGKLNAPNWNDKNPFKILVPGFILQESINRDSQ